MSFNAIAFFKFWMSGDLRQVTFVVMVTIVIWGLGTKTTGLGLGKDHGLG